MFYVEIQQNNQFGFMKFGPYTEIKKGPYTDFIGVKPDGTEEDIFEVTVGEGGYCDTCAYNFPSIHIPSNNKQYGYGDTDLNVVHFRFYYQED